MRKSEAERLIRTAVHDWVRETEFDRSVGKTPSFLAFKGWLLARWPDALSFNSVGGAQYAAEMWFDEELGEKWTR
jgi:hypothetical protein